MKKKHWLWLAAFLLVLILYGIVAGPSPRQGASLDPHSTAPDGTKALVMLLDGLGAQVQLGTSPEGSGTALVLQNRLNRTDTAAVLNWVKAGGRLVTTDAASFGDVLGTSQSLGFELPAVTPHCNLPELRSMGAIEPGTSNLFKPLPGQIACFPSQGGYFLIERHLGAGMVIALGGANPFINSELGKVDDSVLAARLLMPEGNERITVLGASATGAGSQTLASLVSPRIYEAIGELLIAFLLFAAWRARRLGKPVIEAPKVELPASELVVAEGNLLQEGGKRAHAAELLRSRLRYKLAQRLGAARDTPLEHLVVVAADRIPISEQRLAEALDGPTPHDDSALVALAQSVAQIEQEIDNAR